MKQADERPVLSFTHRTEWAAWLDENHGTSSGAWLRLAKKASGQESVSYAEAVEVALCYGWIDGQAKHGGDEHWLQKFTRRGKRSNWSRRNREKALALIASGDMHPAGLAEVQRAQADRRWDGA